MYVLQESDVRYLNVRLPSETMQRMKAHMRGGESYADFLAVLLDYLEGGQVYIPWPRPTKDDWANGRVQGYAVLPRGTVKQ